MTAVLEVLHTTPGIEFTTADSWTSLRECAGLFMPVAVSDAAWRDAGMSDHHRCWTVLLAAHRAGIRNDGSDHAVFTVPGTVQHRPTLLVLSVSEDPEPHATITLFGEGVE